jgi:hypothetical protein
MSATSWVGSNSPPIPLSQPHEKTPRASIVAGAEAVNASPFVRLLLTRPARKDGEAGWRQPVEKSLGRPPNNSRPPRIYTFGGRKRGHSTFQNFPQKKRRLIRDQSNNPGTESSPRGMTARRALGQPVKRSLGRLPDPSRQPGILAAGAKVEGRRLLFHGRKKVRWRLLSANNRPSSRIYTLVHCASFVTPGPARRDSAFLASHSAQRRARDTVSGKG